jgi:hypothetical protein
LHEVGPLLLADILAPFIFLYGFLQVKQLGSLSLQEILGVVVVHSEIKIVHKVLFFFVLGVQGTSEILYLLLVFNKFLRYVIG